MSDAKDARIAELEAEVGQLKGELEAEKDKKRVVDYAEAVQYAEMKRRATTAEAERDALREAVRVLGTAVQQLRGALILDHMVQSNGTMFGTTTQALEAAKACDTNPIARAAIAGKETAKADDPQKGA